MLLSESRLGLISYHCNSQTVTEKLFFKPGQLIRYERKNKTLNFTKFSVKKRKDRAVRQLIRVDTVVPPD